MQAADLFAYLAAFVSIVLAVALTDMVHSAHRLLRARKRIRWDPLAPMLAIAVFILLLWQFFGLWGDARSEELTFNGLLALVTVPTIYAFAAFAVLPDEVPDKGLDLHEFYFENRRYVALVLALGTLGDVVRTLRFGAMHQLFDNFMFWGMFAFTFAGGFACLAIIYFARSWTAQMLAVLSFLVVTYIPSMSARIEAISTH